MSTLISHGHERSGTRREAILTPEGVTLPEGADEPVAAPHPSGWLAALRIATGFVFLWAFLDKTFGLDYATPSEGAWINGGSPTEGFLSHVDVGPFADLFNDIAGQGWTNWMFMLGLLGIGVAAVLGIGLRIAAVSGVVMMGLMWAAEWPLAQFNGAGEPTGSNNPLVDYHVVYALALVVVAVTHAGHRFGLGRIWGRLPIVERHRSILE